MAKNYKIIDGIGYIPEGVTRVDRFHGDDSLQKIDIPEGVTVISEDAFFACHNLREVKFPESLEVIEENAFRSCTSLCEIKLPESLKVIEENAFRNCTSLKEIKFPESLEVIEDFAFHGCRSLKKIFIPKNVNKIKRAFRYCSLTEIRVDPDNTFYDSRDNCNAIISTRTSTLIAGCGSTVIPDNIMRIGAEAFRGCDNLKKIEIPDSIVEIIGDTFKDCPELEELILPKSVVQMGGGVVAGCPKLSSIKVDERNPIFDSREDCNAIIVRKENGDELIASCSKTVIPTSVKFLKNSSFMGTVIPEIKVPDNIELIGGYTFAEITAPVKVVLSKGMTRIPCDAFKRSSGLIAVEIPDSVKRIGDYAFFGCSGLKEVKIPESVEIMDHDAFNGCSSLEEINIPDSVEKIDIKAFENCSSVRSIKFSRNMRIIDVGVFSGCSGLKSLVIPEGITEIRYCAFGDCKSLEEIEIPTSVEILDKDAFRGCDALKHVTIKCPISLKGNGKYFYSSTGLKTITFGKNVKVHKLDFWAFYEEWAQNLEAIYVPHKCVKYYANRIPESLRNLIKELPAE